MDNSRIMWNGKGGLCRSPQQFQPAEQESAHDGSGCFMFDDNPQMYEFKF